MIVDLSETMMLLLVVKSFWFKVDGDYLKKSRKISIMI